MTGTTVNTTNEVKVHSVSLRLQGQGCVNRLFVEFDAEVPVDTSFNLIGAVYTAVLQLVPTPEASSLPLIQYLLGEDVATFQKRWRVGELDPTSLRLGYYKITSCYAGAELSIDFALESHRNLAFSDASTGNYRDVTLNINEITPYCGVITARLNTATGIGILGIEAPADGVTAHMRIQGRLELRVQRLDR